MPEDIQYNTQATPGAAYVTEAPAPSTGTQAAKKYEPGLSTIEQSEMAAEESAIASMSFPILSAPSHQHKADTIVGLVGGLALLNKMDMSIISQGVLDAWMNDIKKTKERAQEEIALIITSPAYQALREIKIHGDSHSGSVAGVQNSTSANAAAAGANFTIISALENARLIERVHPTNSTAETDPANIMIPMTAIVFIGGALAIGGLEMSVSPSGMSSNPVQGAMQIIDEIGPSLKVSMDQLIPMINLMVMAPIYYNSWNEAVSRLANKEGSSPFKTAQKYAQEVIKMISNPDYVMATFVNKMEGADQMSPDSKQEVATVMRLILATVALSLLYSVETGTTLLDEFGGIQPEELREILMGTKDVPDPTTQKNLQGKLSSTLVNFIKTLLSALPGDMRGKAMEAILSYVTTGHKVENMLDPNKVFNDVFEYMKFNEEEAKQVDKKAV